MKNKILITIILAIFITNFAKTQDLSIYQKQKENAKKGYIITKNNEYKHVLLFEGLDKDNSEYIVYINNMQAPVQKYSKYDILEYGYDNIVYETMDRNGEIVFMQRINNSEPYVYYYKEKGIKEFYIKTDDKFELLPNKKKELVNTLNIKYKECELTPKITKLAMHNKRRLQSITKRLDECSNHKIPYFKIGVMGGFTNYNVIFKNNNEDNISMTIPYYGIFLNIPISKTNLHFTFKPEIEFLRIDQYREADENTDVSCILTNIFFRYNNLRHPNSLYIDFGYINTRIKSPESAGATRLYGLGAGIGIDINVSNRTALNIGLRGSYSISEYEFSTWDTGVHVGLSF